MNKTTSTMGSPVGRAWERASCRPFTSPRVWFPVLFARDGLSGYSNREPQQPAVAADDQQRKPFCCFFCCFFLSLLVACDLLLLLDLILTSCCCHNKYDLLVKLLLLSLSDFNNNKSDNDNNNSPTQFKKAAQQQNENVQQQFYNNSVIRHLRPNKKAQQFRAINNERNNLNVRTSTKKNIDSINSNFLTRINKSPINLL